MSLSCSNAEIGSSSALKYHYDTCHLKLSYPNWLAFIYGKWNALTDALEVGDTHLCISLEVQRLRINIADESAFSSDSPSSGYGNIALSKLSPRQC